MEKIRMQEFIIPAKNVKKKVIYHFSDSHFTEWDDLSTDAEKEHALKMTASWENVRAGFCELSGEGYGELQKQAPIEHFRNLIATASDGDALIIAGDTLDYISPANLRTLDRELARYEKPFIAVCGNHENKDDIPENLCFSGIKNEVQVLSLGDMVIIGIDDSKREISEAQLEFIKASIFEGLPILLAMHVPIMTDGNFDRLTKSGVYFQLNYDGCPSRNLEFIELIKQNADSFIAVLAGHLHYPDISEVASGLTQYVTGQGVTGNINKYVIGE